MTSYKDYFSMYKAVDNGIVYMGNNQACEIVGIGTVTITMADGTERIIHGVPNLSWVDGEGCLCV